jgi:hypothetical protein
VGDGVHEGFFEDYALCVADEINLANFGDWEVLCWETHVFEAAVVAPHGFHRYGIVNAVVELDGFHRGLPPPELQRQHGRVVLFADMPVGFGHGAKIATKPFVWVWVLAVAVFAVVALETGDVPTRDDRHLDADELCHGFVPSSRYAMILGICSSVKYILASVVGHW